MVGASGPLFDPPKPMGRMELEMQQSALQEMRVQMSCTLCMYHVICLYIYIYINTYIH